MTTDTPSDFEWFEWQLSASEEDGAVRRVLVVAKHKLISRAVREYQDGVFEVGLWDSLCTELQGTRPTKGTHASMLKVAYITRRAEQLIKAERARLEKISTRGYP